jgi:hypothetical protein
MSQPGSQHQGAIPEAEVCAHLLTCPLAHLLGCIHLKMVKCRQHMHTCRRVQKLPQVTWVQFPDEAVADLHVACVAWHNGAPQQKVPGYKLPILSHIASFQDLVATTPQTLWHMPLYCIVTWSPTLWILQWKQGLPAVLVATIASVCKQCSSVAV